MMIEVLDRWEVTLESLRSVRAMLDATDLIAMSVGQQAYTLVEPRDPIEMVLSGEVLVPDL